jgi:hypothetical protein
MQPARLLLLRSGVLFSAIGVVQGCHCKMKIHIAWIVVVRVGLGARMSSFLVEMMMVELSLVCLGDTCRPSSMLS